MEIKNRLFPYPVLCGDTDDYIDSTEFILEPTVEETIHELLLEYDYTVKCNSLETALRKGEVEYVLHIECSETCFRIALKSPVPHIEYRLPKGKVNGKITLVAMLVAKTDIINYGTAELNEDYAEEIINFKKGNILAYQNLPPIFVTKKTEDLAKNESFFSVIRQSGLDPNEIKPLTFNLYNDKIQIIVDDKTYEAFVRYQQTRSIAMAMLVLPAVTFMVNEVVENPENYERYLWFQRMDKYYQSIGMDFVQDILGKDDNPVNIAQEMLQNPVSKAYRELYALEG